MLDNQRRSLLRLGVLFLLIGVLLGLVTAAPVPRPSKWMAAHLSVLMTGLLLIGQGLLWRDLRLTDRQFARTLMATKLGVWGGLALNIANPVLAIPGPATEPGLVPAGIQIPVLIGLLVVIVPATLTSLGYLLYRLRGDAT